MVYNLMDKAILLADQKFHAQNEKTVYNILLLNGYPKYFIQKYMNKRLHTQQHRFNNNNSNNHQTNLKRNYAQEFKVKLNFKNDSYCSIKNILRKHNINSIPYVNQNLSQVIKNGKDKSKRTECTGKVPSIKYSANSAPPLMLDSVKEPWVLDWRNIKMTLTRNVLKKLFQHIVIITPTP